MLVQTGVVGDCSDVRFGGGPLTYAALFPGAHRTYFPRFAVLLAPVLSHKEFKTHTHTHNQKTLT